jgi:hypothetical protein
MKLHAPFFISARLLPALKLGDLIISLEMLPREPDGRNRYRYFIDPPAGCRAKPLEASDLRSGCQGGTLVLGFGSLLCFLDSAAESKRWGERTGHPGEDAGLFPAWVLDRVDESEIGYLRELIEPDGRTNEGLIEA